MKIFIAVHHYPPRYTAGAELQAYRTASALHQRGHSVQVACVEHVDGNGSDDPSVVTSEMEPYEGIPVHRISLGGGVPLAPSQMEFDNQAIGDHIRSILATQKPDVYHQVGGYLLTGSPLAAAKELKIPTVVTLVDFWFLCPRIQLLRTNGELSSLPVDAQRCLRCIKEESRRYRWLGRFFPSIMQAYWNRHSNDVELLHNRSKHLRKILQQTDTIIAPSNFIRDMYVKGGLKSPRIDFIRQGMESAFSQPVGKERNANGILFIGYIGQISRHKGVHTLIKATRMLKESSLKVKIYGDHTQDQLYTRYLERLRGDDSRISFEGAFQGKEALGRVLRGIDVLVVPSLCYENSPNVILEAFIYKTPVVASALGGMAELVQAEQNGLLFEVGNARALAEQLRRMVDDPSLLNQLVQGGIQATTVAEEMDALEAIYRALS